MVRLYTEKDMRSLLVLVLCIGFAAAYLIPLTEDVPPEGEQELVEGHIVILYKKGEHYVAKYWERGLKDFFEKEGGHGEDEVLAFPPGSFPGDKFSEYAKVELEVPAMNVKLEEYQYPVFVVLLSKDELATKGFSVERQGRQGSPLTYYVVPTTVAAKANDPAHAYYYAPSVLAVPVPHQAPYVIPSNVGPSR